MIQIITNLIIFLSAFWLGAILSQTKPMKISIEEMIKKEMEDFNFQIKVFNDVHAKFIYSHLITILKFNDYLSDNYPDFKKKIDSEPEEELKDL